MSNLWSLHETTCFTIGLSSDNQNPKSQSRGCQFHALNGRKWKPLSFRTQIWMRPPPFPYFFLLWFPCPSVSVHEFKFALSSATVCPVISKTLLASCSKACQHVRVWQGRWLETLRRRSAGKFVRWIRQWFSFFDGYDSSGVSCLMVWVCNENCCSRVRRLWWLISWVYAEGLRFLRQQGSRPASESLLLILIGWHKFYIKLNAMLDHNVLCNDVMWLIGRKDVQKETFFTAFLFLKYCNFVPVCYHMLSKFWGKDV